MSTKTAQKRPNVSAWRIERPPLYETFEVPTREELLDVKIGDFVKVIFRDSQDFGERMWMLVTKCDEGDEWEGELNNHPVLMEAEIACGDLVKFHPYDVISIMKK